MDAFKVSSLLNYLPCNWKTLQINIILLQQYGLQFRNFSQSELGSSSSTRKHKEMNQKQTSTHDNCVWNLYGKCIV